MRLTKPYRLVGYIIGGVIVLALMVGVFSRTKLGENSRSPSRASRAGPGLAVNGMRVDAALRRYVTQSPARAVQADLKTHGPVVRVTCQRFGKARYRKAPVSLCFIHYADGLSPVWCAAVVKNRLYTVDRTPGIPCPRVGLPAPALSAAHDSPEKATSARMAFSATLSARRLATSSLTPRPRLT